MPPIDRAIEVVTGTVGHVTVELPFAWVASIDTGIDGQVAVEVGTGAGHDGVTLNATVTAPVDGEPGAASVTIDVVGCRTADDPCPAAERQSATVLVGVSVVEPGGSDTFEVIPPTDPSRLVEQPDGSAVLPDELSVLFVDGVDRTDAVEAISAAGGQVVGGREVLGLYRARFDSGTITDAQAQLEALPAVDSVTPAAWLPFEVDAVPSDWDDDQGNDDATWPFEATGATTAWDTATGGPIEVGVVDFGIWPDHSDLTAELNRVGVVDRYTYFGEKPVARDYATYDGHGTHVAGTLCASGNGIGLVGVMWSCSLNALDMLHATVANDELATQIDHWLRSPERRGGDGLVPERPVRVVNMSFGAGAHPSNGCTGDHPGWSHELAWRRLVDANPATLFVVAAGNCPDRSVVDAIPSALAPFYDNVVAVSATGYHQFEEDAPLAPYSAPDGEVAAPGGTEERPIWSTMYRPLACASDGPWCRLESTWSDHTNPVGGKSGPMIGTSMAAPFVAGVAGLMLEVNPTLTPRQLAFCLTESANTTSVTTAPGERPAAHGLGEIRVDRAVGCARGAAAVAPGFFHTCALQLDGRVACWGDNTYGQLGNGTTTHSSIPVAVRGLDDAVAVTSGFFQACALRADGTVWCWGGNGYGAIGDGTWDDRPAPVQVAGLTNVAQVDTGWSSTCAVEATGAVWCWGSNNYGQLGYAGVLGSVSLVPQLVPGVPPAVRVSVGEDFACAVTELGEVWCWGRNESGQLGGGTIGEQRTPAPVPDIGFALDVSTGDHHTCAVSSDGTARCWGGNTSGELGDGTTEDRLAPTPVVGLEGAVRVAAGGEHSCARLIDGTARCWGVSWAGQTGDGVGSFDDGTAYSNRLTPVPVAGLAAVVDIQAGWAHACAVLGSGAAMCWGNNMYNQIGDGTGASRFTPVPVGA